MGADRTVHARSQDGHFEIVRYDRAGKWYVEYASGSLKPCIHVGVGEAARRAVESGALVFFRRPGGKAFDHRVRQLDKDYA